MIFHLILMLVKEGQNVWSHNHFLSEIVTITDRLDTTLNICVLLDDPAPVLVSHSKTIHGWIRLMNLISRVELDIDVSSQSS